VTPSLEPITKSHRDCGGAQKGICGHGKGFKKTTDLMGTAIIDALTPFKAKVKTLTYENGNEFCEHAKIY
jgi:hypothetical protein